MSRRDRFLAIIPPALYIFLYISTVTMFSRVQKVYLSICLCLQVVHPLAQTAGDVLEPLARALGAVRLVHVRVDSRPACRCARDLV